MTGNIQDSNLTDEQEAKIAAVRKERRAKVEEAVKKLTTPENTALGNWYSR